MISPSSNARSPRAKSRGLSGARNLWVSRFPAQCGKFILSMSKGSTRTVLSIFMLGCSSQVFAETVAITGGKVIVGDGSAPIENGTVVIRDGNIVAAGKDIAVPAGARMIDATGKWVTPGIFAGFSRLDR